MVSVITEMKDLIKDLRHFNLSRNSPYKGLDKLQLHDKRKASKSVNSVTTKMYKLSKPSILVLSRDLKTQLKKHLKQKRKL